jgi:acyl-coenzyme A thioesterase PaaI-like protein
LGKQFFSYCVRFVNPYSGSLGAEISVLKKGYAEVLLQDKKKNRNHLDCVHALALSNLGELTSGMAVLCSIDANTRGIVTHISVDFLKKARGKLRCVCSCDIPEIKGDTAFTVSSDIFNEDDEKVAKVDVTWQLGLKI